MSDWRYRGLLIISAFVGIYLGFMFILVADTFSALGKMAEMKIVKVESEVVREQIVASETTYHYTMTSPGGERPEVTDVVSYDENGLYLQSEMSAVFSNENAAREFVERVRSDYGSNFISGTTDGVTARVKVSMAHSGLSREDYEKSLGLVVNDLVVE